MITKVITIKYIKLLTKVITYDIIVKVYNIEEVLLCGS